MIEREKARIHRSINTGLFLATIVALLMVYTSYQHNIEDCESQLYEKLTNQKAPTIKDLCHDTRKN